MTIDFQNIPTNSRVVANGDNVEITVKSGNITSSSTPLSAQKGATLTVDGGDYTSTNTVAVWSGGRDTTGHVVINNGHFTAKENAVATMYKSTVEINDGEFVAQDNAVVAGNGSLGQGETDITINGGTFEGGITTDGYIACGIYQPQDGNLTINGGTFKVNGGAGIVIRGGNVKLNGGNFITSGDAIGKVGDSPVKVGCYPVVIDAQANYPAWPTCKTTISGGTYKSETLTDTSVQTIGAVNDKLVINGGTFSPAAKLD